jgi:hypothetical protein
MIKWKLRKLAAALIVAGITHTAAAQDPPAAFPVPAAEEPIEIIYGTQRVNPEPMPPPVADPVVPASATTIVDAAKNSVSFLEAMASVREGTREMTSAAVGLLGRVGDRVKHTVDSRPIIIHTHTPAPAVLPTPPPQVVVVREAASEPRPVVEAPPAAIRVDTLVLGGLGIAAVAAVSWLGFRKSQKTLPNTFALAPAPLDPDGVNLMGKYNAGPKREAAEKFDLGPTYQDEMKQKEQQAEAGNTAVVQFILEQNLAFLAEANPGHEGTMVETDTEGYAVPAMA